MATKPLTSEAIALTEKKMDMTLDDIIKMSKNNSTKVKQQQQHRPPNKGLKVFNNAAQGKALKVRQYMGSRSSLRQGVLAQRRSNFQGNHFPLTTEVARQAAVAPARSRAFNSSMVANKTNRARFGALPFQRRSANGSFLTKSHQQQQRPQQENNAVPNVTGMRPNGSEKVRDTKQRPQTLDSLFANMKEQRMKAFTRLSNSGQGNGGRPRVPWARGRFGN